MKQAVAIGLKGLAITDHHSIGGYQAAQRWLERTRIQEPKTSLPHLWTGVEVTSDLWGTEVHILGYAFDPEHWAMETYLQGDRPLGRDSLAAKVIAAIHQAGGLVVLAHPSRYRRPADELIPAAAELGIDGVEAYYAYGNPKPWQPSLMQSQQAKKLSEKYGLFATCGTDTHGLNLLQRV
jgi:predicted metal-dependent phosphoesterase TrpH